jgi:hypothetical protein
VAKNSRWEHDGQPFFDGEVEPCINGRTVALGAYFGVDVEGIVSGRPDPRPPSPRVIEARSTCSNAISSAG